ncbi:hypothetical protein ACFLYD_02245 [Chloroflexota bacterium]
MRIFGRLAFYLGLAVGLVTVAAAGTVALTYLLTGKLPGVKLGGEEPEITLLTPDEVVDLVRAQVDQAKGEAGLVEDEGGEYNVEA